MDWKDAAALWRAGFVYVRGDGRGLAGSLALHALVALLVLLMILRGAGAPPPGLPPHLVPVEIVQAGPETTSPPEPVKARVPQPVTPHRAPHEPAAANRPEGTSPTGTKPVDDLETRLHALARLRQPESSLKPIETPSAADTQATSDDATPGSQSAYAVRDLIRAQVTRRWNFDVAALGTGSFFIALRIVVLKNGTVAQVDILDRERYTKDALYRDIALSARNAVLLSSPLTLPPGAIDYSTEVTLNLNPRDTLR